MLKPILDSQLHAYDQALVSRYLRSALVHRTSKRARQLLTQSLSLPEEDDDDCRTENSEILENSNKSEKSSKPQRSSSLPEMSEVLIHCLVVVADEWFILLLLFILIFSNVVIYLISKL